ncbi:MAG: glycosyltransferase family 4 protein, partial [Anaerolineae bacterium]|nr:glycosyltransferase family 4 protein [Anaerolineae bacterium]
MSDRPDLRLLWFNLTTDADDPIHGFTTGWINAVAPYCAALDVVTMRAGRLALADPVRVFSVGKEKGYSEPRRALEFYRILTGLLRHQHYDACFSHMNPLFAVMAAPLLIPYRIPVTLWYAHKATPLRLRLAARLVRHLVTASPESLRLDSPKRLIIGHGIDTTVFTPAATPRPAERPFTVLSVSRIAPVKRLEILIETARRTAQPPHFRIIGSVYPQDAAYADSLRQQICDAGLETIVELAGEVAHHEIAETYRQADVMVNLSDTGSVDKAVLEAMACGLPVVTSNEAFRAIRASLVKGDNKIPDWRFRERLA